MISHNKDKLIEVDENQNAPILLVGVALPM